MNTTNLKNLSSYLEVLNHTTIINWRAWITHSCSSLFSHTYWALYIYHSLYFPSHMKMQNLHPVYFLENTKTTTINEHLAIHPGLTCHIGDISFHKVLSLMNRANSQVRTMSFLAVKKGKYPAWLVSIACERAKLTQTRTLNHPSQGFWFSADRDGLAAADADVSEDP